jgi:hypothetical protein
MSREIALSLAARILSNLMGYRSKKDYRMYQSDLNYMADCIMNAFDGQTYWKAFQPKD